MYGWKEHDKKEIIIIEKIIFKITFVTEAQLQNFLGLFGFIFAFYCEFQLFV